MSSKNRIKKANVWMRTSATSLGFYSYGYTIGIFNSSLSCINSRLEKQQPVAYFNHVCNGITWR